MTIQVTLISEGGYRPLSTLIEVESWEAYQENKRKWNDRAIVKICGKRYMTAYDLKKYGYTTLKARPYDPEQIAREKEERYNKIKQERGWI